MQTLLNDSAFAGTNVIGLLKSRSDRLAISENIRLTSHDRLDYFTVVPSEGRIISYNAERGRDIPSSDAVPGFEAVRNRAFQLAEMFGISTNEMELEDNGSVHVRRAEGSNAALGGAVKYKTNRSVKLLRSLAGYTFGSFTDDKIELDLGVNGRLRKFDLRWRSTEAVSTNKVASISQIMEAIQSGQGFADVTNEYPEEGIALIELKDFEIQYHVCTFDNPGTTSAKTEIRPVISFNVMFKSKTGKTEEGGIYAPLILSP